MLPKDVAVALEMPATWAATAIFAMEPSNGPPWLAPLKSA